VQTIRINSDAIISRQQISPDQFCIIVDDFLQDPGELIAYANSHREKFSLPDRGYPGILCDLENALLAEVYGFIRNRFRKEFAFLKGGIRFSSVLSIATLQPQELNWAQRFCHTDPRTDSGRDNFAALLYLFDRPELGGTAFYRWTEQPALQQATEIGQDDAAAALEFLQARFSMFKAPACYMTDTNEVAELLTLIPAKFNRLIFYSGDTPHSAYISAPELLATDPSKGRLTLNCFASALPRK
jgi:hypothetical protein